MARPPAWAGGRSGLLTGEEREKPKRPLSAFFQRVPICVPSPPSRWAGRYGPFAGRAAGQVLRQKYSLPLHNPTREGGPGEEPPPPGVLSPFLPKKWGPGRAGPVPRRSNGVGKSPHHGPYPDRPKGVPPHPSCAAIFSASSVRYTHRSIFSSRAAFSRACSSVSSWSFT